MAEFMQPDLADSSLRQRRNEQAVVEIVRIKNA
jgi:hypothetical protein